MSLRAVVTLAAITAVAAPTVARADAVTYQAAGSAPAADADARTRALDAAFASAVTEAVADLAGKAARTQAAAVDREIVRRARRFVASFAVSREQTVGAELQLEVAVKIDRDKLAARLVELGVELRALPPPVDAPPTVTLPSALVLYRVTGAGPVVATFGDGAAIDAPGQGALTAGLARAGYRTTVGAAGGPAPDDDGELPLDDVSARALAAEARADVALVVGVAVGAPGMVRGTPLVAAPARAWLRVVDTASGKVTIDAAVATAAWGDRSELERRAVDAAAAAIARRAFGTAAPPAATVTGPPLVARAGTTVRFVGVGAWQAAALVRIDLTASPGVTAIHYAGVASDVVALAVDGSTVDKIAAVARATPGFAAKTRVEDGVVVVRVKSIDAPGAE